MKTAHEVVIAAMRRVDGDPPIRSLVDDRRRPVVVHRTYFGSREKEGPATFILAPAVQILNEDQMEDACVRFLQRSLHRAGNESPPIVEMYARLMWLCAIENVTCAIYQAATTEDQIRYKAVWVTAFNTAKIYTSVYGTKLGEWALTSWPIKPHLCRASDAISLWATRGERQPDNSLECIAALEATDALRSSLLYAAEKGRFDPKAANP